MSAPIVIAGAGIGGLSAALALARAGKRVIILERAAKIEEVGAGLQIAPNAGRILAGLGLESALAAVALEPQAINIRRGRDGSVLARLDLSDSGSRWGAPFRVFHRADLQQALLQAALAHEAIEIRTSARVGDFTERSGRLSLRAHGEGGVEEIDASGLVGADGQRSAVRAHLFPTERDAPYYSGLTAWRALVPAELAPAALRARESNLWMLPGAHVVHYPLRDGSIINVVVIVAEEPRAADGAAILALEGPELARLLAPKGPGADLLSLVQAGASWRHWPLFARPPLSKWSRGAVTLLGDAAHPMLPFLAQGAAQAIEDAAALGTAFLRLGVGVEAAFADYERSRIARASRIVRASRRQGDYFHISGPASVARDFAIRALGGRGMLARNAWLYR
ncbi:FAD-dependent monooxygenase [Methylocystis parvus]|uniref:FAD-binding protein n=1 Tax=Methylocystis parvus TaxID=134 RepID=A0A6B8M5B7_9HYPH|nr:FAD-dependent monooxygenase [Methylocystis parvus]QGM96523.1 FAD-binding protein [Methylocystis parvus]WBJ99625.1 FAD-dependent monooxygenase [Methylocystis parvus OBBP]